VCFFPAILFGLHWQRGTASGTLASMVAGVTVLLVWMLVGPRESVHEVFPALLVSCLTYSLFALRSEPAIRRLPDR
jgi:Na+/proline symporter